jgi:hypothetical protein
LITPAVEKDVNKGKRKKKLTEDKKKLEKDIFTKNIVYKEVLAT